MERINLGEQREPGNRGGRRVSPGYNFPQEEIFMDGLDVTLPPVDWQGPGLDWSVTLHTTNGDVTLDSRQTGNGIRI